MLVVVILLANLCIALIALRGLQEDRRWVDRSLKAMAALHDTGGVAVRMGLNQRIYRVSSDINALGNYRAEAEDLTGKLTKLRGLLDRDEEQSRRLDALTQLIDHDRARLAATLSPLPLSLDAGNLPEELGTSVARSNAIAAATADMETAEASLLRQHHANMLVIMALGTFGSIAFNLLIFVLLPHDEVRSERVAGAALRASELHFRHIFEQSPIGFLLARQDNRHIVQANSAFCRMVGYEAETVIGGSIADFVHIDDHDRLPDAIHAATEIRLVSASGVLSTARLVLTPLSEQDREPKLLLASVEDITRERRIEGELRQAQKMEAIGQLTGGIAHDFNNLLGVIVGNVEFLIDAVSDKPEEAALAEQILTSALSGADLTRRLLAFARRQTLQPRLVDLNAYLPSHLTILRRLLGESIQITTVLAHDLWPTRADPSQIGDALLNMAINARDAMPHGGSIRIRTENAHVPLDDAHGDTAPGDYVVLSVTDSGLGMAPEVLERAMEPFFTTKEPGAGSGLGLSMIFGFAKQSHGHLTIRSTEGRGTTVRLFLPRAEEPMDESDSGIADRLLPTGEQTVLLVDDNEEMRNTARRHLAALGYRVSEAASGPAALDLLRAGGGFDLLFTDVVMPDGMSGYQLASAARTVQPGLKVLFTSGFSPVVDDMGKAAGGMLRKPYRKQDLAVKVRAALDA